MFCLENVVTLPVTPSDESLWGKSVEGLDLRSSVTWVTLLSKVGHSSPIMVPPWRGVFTAALSNGGCTGAASCCSCPCCLCRPVTARGIYEQAGGDPQMRPENQSSHTAVRSSVVLQGLALYSQTSKKHTTIIDEDKKRQKQIQPLHKIESWLLWDLNKKLKLDNEQQVLLLQ